MKDNIEPVTMNCEQVSKTNNHNNNNNVFYFEESKQAAETPS